MSAAVPLPTGPLPTGPLPAAGPAAGVPVVRCTSPDDVVAMIPWLCGFRPTESLVVVCLLGSRLRVGLTLRLDLGPEDDPPADAPGLDVIVDETVTRVRYEGAAAALVLCWTEGADGATGTLPRTALVDRLVDALSAAGVEVPDALLVRGGRRWSYLCGDACCPPEGVALPAEPSSEILRMGAEQTLAGRTVLADRSALERTVQGPSGTAALAAAGVLQRVDGELTAEMADRPAAGRRTRAVLRRALARSAEGRPGLLPEEAARIALGLFDKDVRDEAGTWALTEAEPALRSLLSEVARATPDPDCAAVCALLGWVAYVGGDGALARVAAERAVRAEPHYTLGGLVLEGLDRQVPPGAVREVVAQHAAELAAGTSPGTPGRGGWRPSRTVASLT